MYKYLYLLQYYLIGNLIKKLYHMSLVWWDKKNNLRNSIFKYYINFYVVVSNKYKPFNRKVKIMIFYIFFSFAWIFSFISQYPTDY